MNSNTKLELDDSFAVCHLNLLLLILVAPVPLQHVQCLLRQFVYALVHVHCQLLQLLLARVLLEQFNRVLHVLADRLISHREHSH